MLNATNTPRWRAWLLLAVACWAGVAPAFALAFTPGFSLRGPETRVWNFFPQPAETRQETEPQVADSHQGNEGYGYEIVSGVHVYLYANGNPISFSDPSGRFSLVELQMAMTSVSVLANMAVPTITSVAITYGPVIALWAVRALAVMNVSMFLADQEFRDMTYAVPGGLGMIAADVEVITEMALNVARLARQSMGLLQIAARVKASPNIGNAYALGEAPVGGHNADITLLGRDGKLVSQWSEVSGEQTAVQKATGNGQFTSHTETKALTHVHLDTGETLIIRGEAPPCARCQGTMRITSQRTGARIEYHYAEPSRSEGEELIIHVWENGEKVN